MRTYELMIIVNGSLQEDAVTSLVERFTTLIADQGGNVAKVDHWGKRQFAYEIQHMNEGYYTVIDFSIGPDGLAELERQLRITDEVLRHKVIWPEGKMRRVS